MSSPQPDRVRSLVAHTRLLLDSHERLLGRSLIPRGEDEAGRLFCAPFALVSHGTEAEPIFNYGNERALQLWGVTWEELTAMPSRATVAGDDLGEEERRRMLEKVRLQGYIDNYRGVRVTKSGRRFRIERAIVWNLIDDNGDYRGQAATFGEWEFLPGTSD